MVVERLLGDRQGRQASQAEKHDTKVIINNIAAKNGGDEMDELYYYYYYYSSELTAPAARIYV